jgi:predicted nucleotidyltransferase
MIQEEFKRYLLGHTRQIAQEEEELRENMRLADEKARRIIAKLVKIYGLSRAYLYGSLAFGDFNVDSDIDIAVEGLPEELFFKAYGLAEEGASPFKVDLVLLESAMPSLRERILKEGKLIYDLQREKDCPPSEIDGRPK